MRKFVYQNAVKYTDNEQKAKQLERLGYVEVADDGHAPKYEAHVAQEPRNLEGEENLVEVEKGRHTTEEATTDKVEAGVVGAARIEDDKPVKKAAATKADK